MVSEIGQVVNFSAITFYRGGQLLYYQKHLLPVMQATLQTLGDAPARTLQELALRLQIAIEDAQAHVDAIAEQAAALSLQDDDDAGEPLGSEPAHPLFVTTVQNDRSCVRTTRLNRRSVIAARSAVTQSRT
jgi:hypothetical protein